MNMVKLKPFKNPIFVTRPLLPDLDKVTNKLQEIWSAKWLTNMGVQHNELEKKLQQHLKANNVSLFNNGTIALITACKGLNLTGEVITTPFTFAATPHALTWANLSPVFCDIDPITMNIDANKIEALITSKTTAIMPVHVFGIPCDVLGIEKIAIKHKLKVIYDAAHAFGVELNGVGLGNYGDISMLSFHATKLFHTAEGGALIFKDDSLRNELYLLKNFGIKNEEEVVVPGINGKMNEIQAAIGLTVLDLVEEEVNKRKTLIQTYRRCLKDISGITFLEELPGVKSNYQYFSIRINKDLFGESRDYIYEKLKEYNVFARKYFYPLCSNYPCYQNLPSSNPKNLPVANRVVKEVLSMPLYGELTVEDIEIICIIIKNL